MLVPWQILLVALGSAVGGVLRWAVGLGFARLFGVAFPYGTFFINISGSLFLGWFATWMLSPVDDAMPAGLSRADWRLLIAVGFAGGYTTFSTFEYEAFALLRDGDTWRTTIYLVASVLLGLLAVRLGVFLARGA